MANRYKLLLIVAGIAVVALSTWYYLGLTKQTKDIEGVAEYDSIAPKMPYKKIPLQAFRHVVINCDLGPVKVYFEADEKPQIEIHHTFIKYVEMNYRGDTLVIHSFKTPKSSKANPINRQVYIHTPEVKSYTGEATQTFFSNFSAPYMKIDSRSSYIRLNACEIEQLDLTTNKSCNYMIGSDCAFDRVNAKINPSSAMTILGYVESEFFLTANNLQNIRFGENIRKFRMSKYKK